MLPRLLWITDRRLTNGRSLAQIAGEFVQAGGRFIQIREAGLPSADLLGLAGTIQGAAGPEGMVVVNDRLDIALASGAAGVHCKVTSPRPRELRPFLPSPKLIGASCHNLEQAQAAQASGADYLLLGPVFDTPAKRRYGPPLGLKKVERIINHLSAPVYAVGGVSAENAPLCMQAGAHGIAVIRAITAVDDVKKATEALLHNVKAS